MSEGGGTGGELIEVRHVPFRHLPAFLLALQRNGELVDANLIIAGTNPLATDMVAAHIMGFDKSEVPTFVKAIESGMKPAAMNEIEVRGEVAENVQMAFVKPDLVPWTSVNSWFGAQEVSKS